MLEFFQGLQGNIQSVAIFLIFLGPLVFFHELGHFLFARLAGVKVETFSIGFGPKLFKFKKGDTTYAFSLIPLGGYVKMFGDDPLSKDELTEEEKKVAYTHKGKWARFWIVFGGPLANFILAFCIYLSLVTFGEKVPETRFGKLPVESIFYKAGIRTGDVLTKINDQRITSFDDLNLIDSDVEDIEVKRLSKLTEIPLKMKGMEFVKNFARYNNLFRAPLLVDAKGQKYLLKHSKAKTTDDILSLEEYFNSDLKGFSVSLLTPKGESEAPRFDLSEYVIEKENQRNIIVASGEKLEDKLRAMGLFPSDLSIKSISMDSAAAEAGLVMGNIISKINGKEISSFDELRLIVSQVKEGESLALTVATKSGVKNIDLKPRMMEIKGQKRMLIGIESFTKMLPVKMVERSSDSVAGALGTAWDRTKEGTIKTIAGFKKLITGEVSLKQVGGPLAIGQVASDSFNIGLSMFFRLMALISINLGVINLFPIPVLDGGHIVFIILEAINRKPLSQKKMQYAQQVGMSLLFLLIFVAIFNDISRIF